MKTTASIPKLSQTGTAASGVIHLQLLRRFAGGGQSGKERAEKSEAEHEVDGKENCPQPRRNEEPNLPVSSEAARAESS